MKIRTSIVTLALMAALALAALSGGLLPYAGVVHAADPDFDDNTTSRSIPENTPAGVNIGDPISATDDDEGVVEYEDTLTYSLEGTDAASFDIDPSTGQLITKAPLDNETKASYSVTVKVDDGDDAGNDVMQPVTISVTDVNEPPAAPIAPTVVSGPDDTSTTDTDESTTSLKVVWHAPENTGDDITSYNVEYRKSAAPENDLSFKTDNIDHSGTATTATITGLDADTSYMVRVKATGEVEGPWSLVGTGSTNKEDNSPPTFGTETSLSRRVDENTPAGRNIEGPVTADDANSTNLTYRLEGPDAALFDFETRSGQIRTKSPLNHENPDCGYLGTDDPTACSYGVTVTVVDGAGGSDAIPVTITVTDTTERASAPGRPTVRATEKSSTSLDISWTEPDNTGPAITDYDVRYRTGDGAFTLNSGVAVKGATATISGANDQNVKWLTANTSYEVQVRAKTSGEGDGAWSASGTGKTSKANHEPIFDERPHSGSGSDRKSAFTVSRVVDENVRPGQNIGRLYADDEDGDSLTYDLTGTDAGSFEINASTGQIRTKAGVTYDYEGLTAGSCSPATDVGTDRCYTVTVEVRDGRDTDRVAVDVEVEAADDTITLKIGLRDKLEPPSAPAVTVTSPTTTGTGNDVVAKLNLVWDAPENTGTAISGYDVQYKKGSAAFSDDNCRDATTDDNCNDLGAATTTTTITGLDANTSYSVQVRAKNDEGTGGWSRLVTVKTNRQKLVSGSLVNNKAPAFADPAVTRDVAENTPSGQNIGDTVRHDQTTDNDSSTFTYSLEGRDAALFSIVSSSGQIRTKSSLNHEDPDCGYVSTANQTACSYKVRVKVVDNDGGSAAKDVTINVTDATEVPSAPSAPSVKATKDSGRSLDVTWNEPPRHTGKPPVTDYDIWYRKKGGTFQLWPHGGDQATDSTGDTDRKATITRGLPGVDADPLESKTQYEVRVRATNAEGTSDWSSASSGTTGAGNIRPSFDTAGAVTLTVVENTRSGQSVGIAVSASDKDSDRLTYKLEGPGKDSFTIDSSGQIKTKAALDHETRSSYSLTVKVDDGKRRDNSGAAKSVTITVDDVREDPSAPAAPTVSGIPGSTDSVRVAWNPPVNAGPPVTEYHVHYREAGQGGFGRWRNPPGADRFTIITGLTAGTRYEVQVRAKSAEGQSDWSASGSGSPNPDATNRNPVFAGGSRSLTVAENTGPGVDIGSAISATDPDGDPLTYTLEGADAASFGILSTGSGGQIQTSAALNHEKKSSYSVTVRVTDGRGGTSTANVTIRVTDVAGEAPGTPVAPTVTAASSTSLSVTWDEPANEGPPINDYDYRYRGPTGNWTEVANTRITARAATITDLAASTSYEVQVRASNAEGASDWSNSGIQATLAPGANNPPVFTGGASATREVSATAPAGTNVGDPVKATDADTDDTITYSLEGADAASFSINTGNGQISTKAGVTLTVGQKFSVTVVATDGTDRAEITVAITIIANNAPTFSEGATAIRTVAEGSPAGTNVGGRVSATDADGDSLTYTMGGADAASFSIASTSGQIRTGTALDYETKNSYTVTITAADTAGASAAITVNIQVTDVGPPAAPAAPAVTPTADSSTGLDVNWTAPASGAAITGYDVQYKKSSAAAFTAWSHDGTISNTAITGLDDGTSYDVRVRAASAEGTGAWSASGTGTTTVANTPPAFANAAYSMVVTEGQAVLTNVGDPVTATDPDGGSLTYSLGGADADYFRVVPATGQIQTDRVLDQETKSTHSFTITATDPAGATATAAVIVFVIDVTYGCSTLGAVDASNTGLDRDCEALLEAKGKLEGDGIASLNWSARTPISDWNGISLGGEPKRVTRVILKGMGLAGTVPTELGQVPMLTQLNLRTNKLTGSIPASLNGLTRLERLLLHNNSLAGDIPDLGRLTSLEMLWLSGSAMNLTGPVPAWLNSMSSMESLSLWGNGLSGPIPDLTGMTSLVMLKIQSNNLTGGIPSWLGEMSSVRRLYLHDNQLGGGIPRELADIPNLNHLWLYKNGLTGQIPPELGRLTRLRGLNLRDNNLTGPIPPELGNMSSMLKLRLHNNQLIGPIPSELGNLANMTDLWLSGNQLAGPIPIALGGLDNLRQLSLKNNQLTGTIPSQIGNLADTLTHFFIEGNAGLTGCVPAALSSVEDNDIADTTLPYCP